MLDCELSCEQKPATISALILGCSRLLLGYAGYPYPLIYTRKTWWDANTQPNPVWKLHPLWVAHYTSADRPWLPRDWDDFQIWQYSNKGSGMAYGIQEDHVDLNRARPGFFQQPVPAHHPEVSACIQVTIGDQLYTGESVLLPHTKAQIGKERIENI